MERKHRVKFAALLSSLVSVASLVIISLCIADVPLWLVRLCYGSYLGGYFSGLLLFIIGRKQQAWWDIVTLILLLIESLPLLLALFIWIAFSVDDGSMMSSPG